MSDYTKSTDFASKDALASGNAAKIVKGTEIDTEFNNIATAIATKADTSSPAFTGSPSLPTGTTGVTQSTGDSSTKLATTAFVQTALQLLYPVGSIYTNASVSTNPGTLFGFGTWAAFGAGRVMVGLNASDTSFDTLEETGGSKDSVVVSHTHTASTSITDPGHVHVENFNNTGSGNFIASLGGGSSLVGYVPSSGGTATAKQVLTDSATTGITASTTVSSTGSSGTNANLQPYIVVYMWKRTA